MATAKEYWNSYYQDNCFARGKEPSRFVQQMISRLQKGKTLDLAMGEGVNAAFLAQKGHQVKGFDISKVAVERAQKLAQDSGVSLEAQVADLDLFLFGLMEYDCVIMCRFKPIVDRYYSEVIRSLKQGGTLLIDSLSVEEMNEAIGKDENYRHYYFRTNEVLHHMKGMHILYYNEGEDEAGKQVVQCLARKPLDKDAVKYGLFDMHSKTENKGPSNQMKLAESLFKKK